MCNLHHLPHLPSLCTCPPPPLFRQGSSKYIICFSSVTCPPSAPLLPPLFINLPHPPSLCLCRLPSLFRPGSSSCVAYRAQHLAARPPPPAKPSSAALHHSSPTPMQVGRAATPFLLNGFLKMVKDLCRSCWCCMGCNNPIPRRDSADWCNMQPHRLGPACLREGHSARLCAECVAAPLLSCHTALILSPTPHLPSCYSTRPPADPPALLLLHPRSC